MTTVRRSRAAPSKRTAKVAAQRNKPKTRKRRKKTPGVALIKPNPERGIGWRCRFVDPDTNKTRWRTIPAHSNKTRELREDYAARLSEQILRRQRELAEGAARLTGQPLSEAIDRYFNAHPKLRPATVKAYRGATDKLEAWAKQHRVQRVDDLTRAHLVRFREDLLKTSRDISPHSVNRQLRAVRTVLAYLVDADALPRLQLDDLRRALKQLKAPVERKEFLRVKEIKKLLEAAQRHDAQTFETTRWVRGEGRPTRAKYNAIAPLVCFALLSGMRLGEILALTWENVDLEAGEIYVAAADSKTGKHRAIDLSVSPALHQLLRARRLQSRGKGRVWDHTRDEAHSAMKRLRREYGAPPKFSWQVCRVTAGTYLTCAPGIFGAASAFLSARQLGHSVQVAERHYAGTVRNISHEARTLEEAMQIQTPCAKVADAMGTKAGAKRVIKAAR